MCAVASNQRELTGLVRAQSLAEAHLCSLDRVGLYVGDLG